MRVHVLFGLTRATAGVAVGGLTLATLVAGGDSPASATPATSVMINEVYGGGGNSGATYTNDFVELTNRGDTAVSLDGWSVQYHPSGATGTWQVTQLTGSIAPGGFYLIAEAMGTGGTQALPTTQASGSIAAALTYADSAACQSASVDIVGFGTAAIRETAPAAGASNTASVTTPCARRVYLVAGSPGHEVLHVVRGHRELTGLLRRRGVPVQPFAEVSMNLSDSPVAG